MIALFLFIFGLIIGSFLNVVIYRTIHGESPADGRSKCPECEETIAWYDNIPVLSYILLGGKCRRCHKKISPRYPAIELLTGMLFVWWYVVGFAFFQLSQAPFTVVQPLFWLVVGILLLIIFVTDWLYQIIPDYASLSLGVLALFYRVFLSATGVMRWEDFYLAVGSGLTMMLGMGFLWFITQGRGMGFGDVKFALVMGLLLGWPRSIVAFFLAFILGALFGVILIMLGLKEVHSKIAFGPFLVLATVIALIWGDLMLQWYVSFL
jgi:prepilin signal peptidase PulO-like enzyme (type II secretory pathway)